MSGLQGAAGERRCRFTGPSATTGPVTSARSSFNPGIEVPFGACQGMVQGRLPWARQYGTELAIHSKRGAARYFGTFLKLSLWLPRPLPAANLEAQMPHPEHRSCALRPRARRSSRLRQKLAIGARSKQLSSKPTKHINVRDTGPFRRPSPQLDWEKV